MIDVSTSEIVSTLTRLHKRLKDSLVRVREFENKADWQEEKKRWSSEGTHRQAEIMELGDLIARIQG
jgi:hypothetical protein